MSTESLVERMLRTADDIHTVPEVAEELREAVKEIERLADAHTKVVEAYNMAHEEVERSEAEIERLRGQEQEPGDAYRKLYQWIVAKDGSGSEILPTLRALRAHPDSSQGDRIEIHENEMKSLRDPKDGLALIHSRFDKPCEGWLPAILTLLPGETG